MKALDKFCTLVALIFFPLLVASDLWFAWRNGLRMRLAHSCRLSWEAWLQVWNEGIDP